MIPLSPPWSIRLNESIGCLACSPGWGRKRETSLRLKDWELWLVWKGKGWMRTRDRALQLLPGFCALMRPGGIYDAGHDEDDPIGITYVHFELMEEEVSGKGVKPALKSWPEFWQLHDLDYMEAVTRRIVQLGREAPVAATELLRAVLSDLLHRPPLSPGDSAPHLSHRPRIKEMIARIHAQPHSLPTVKEMAEKMSMSPAHFSRVFHQINGQSPRDFLLQTRIMRARHLLAETDLSIEEIAEQLDYADLYFFSRQFKQKVGIPPSHYRKTGRPDL